VGRRAGRRALPGAWPALAAALAAALVLAPGTARAGECPEAWLHLRTNDPAGAEERARSCLDADPLSTDAALALSKALSRQDRLVEALAWGDLVQRRHPEDPELVIWVARLTAWKGDLDAAWARVKDLPPDRADPDELRFLADLAFWRKDHREAAARYDRVLAAGSADPRARLNRGLSRRDAGDTDGALSDFDALCGAGDRESCLLSDQSRMARSRISAWARFDHWAILERPDAWSLGAGVDGRIPNEWKAGLALEIRPRSYAEKAFGDLFTELWVAGDPAKWATVRVAAGFSVLRRYSPIWSLQVQPTFRPRPGVEVGLLAWRLQFDRVPATVVAPSVLLEWGRWTLLARYYLGIRDDGEVSHSGFAKVDLRIGWPWRVYLAAGAGNRADYLELRGDPAAQWHWTLGAGVSWQVSWRLRLVLDLTYRDERAAASTFRQVRTSLGTEVRF
jgi:YaiO family outer membrane protein